MIANLVYSANPADEIVPRLWLGSIRAAHDCKWLEEHNIQVIFNCTKDIDFIPCPGVEERVRVPVHDDLSQEEIGALTKYSPSVAFEIIRHWKAGKNVLVHCAAGMQRSAASVAFFLITAGRMHADQAIEFIQQKRPIAFRPGANFRAAIDWYDRHFHQEILPAIEGST